MHHMRQYIACILVCMHVLFHMEISLGHFYGIDAKLLTRCMPDFLKSLSMHECMRVYAPKAIKNSGVILALNDRLNNCGFFSVPFYGSCRRYH